MITELYMENIALIDQLRLTFSPRLNVLTGETGAGKSVILRSLGLVLGERASSNIVRQRQDQAVAQISTDPEPLTFQQMRQVMGDVNLDPEEYPTLHRQVSKSGRSRSNINGNVVNLNQLKLIGDLLVDIHGQHQHQSLFQKELHHQILDDFGGLTPLRQQVADPYEELLRLKRQIAKLSQSYQQLESEKELLAFQVEDIETAELEVGEEERLQNEHKRLANAQQLYELSDEIYSGLYRGQIESSVLDTLKGLNKSFSKLLTIDDSVEETSRRLESALYEIEDLAHEVRNYRDQVEFLPGQLDKIEDRLGTINRLKQKYGATIQQILDHYQTAVEKLEKIELSSDQIQDLQEQSETTQKLAQDRAQKLSTQRRTIARKLERLIQKELHTLSMEKSQFRIAQRQIALGSSGIDEIEFLISTNVGSELKPLTQIASGGEISRVMLALKSVLAQTDLIPTLVFDEIDAGIGGHTANVVGQKLKDLSQFRQLICITHLPQIASLADKHFRVEKKIVGNQTLISAKELTMDERIEEIARMQGGRDTQTAIAHAKELLKDQSTG
ncbi:MAG: DNA repair protein RecN [Candidatus Poribacteria bacterium]|jgi:DNA repair protein RecN (Recombination protein N)|nr:DNA repair protein RecN [Candidatus Poribacteria bacterium]MDP6749412.1 DNA repair protein RecN [Candidatus Poribacteria bacterium]MDP6994575.1 DNA repair protein RecN [Candidatus Poribacteria bacterium]